MAATNLDWVFVRAGFDSQDRTTASVQTRLGFFSNVCSGKAWFDDVKLEKWVQPDQHDGKLH